MDKFRQTYPIALTFTEGELPTASKLQGIATQARSGQGIIQYALGDLWNQSGDNVLTDVQLAGTKTQPNALMIPNLARYLGSTKYLNPTIPYLPDIEEFTYPFTLDAGNYEAHLPFPPAGVPGYTWNAAALAAGMDVVPQASRGFVVAAGNWYLDDETGQFYSFDVIAAGWTLTYNPVIDGNISNVPGEANSTATYNVIPDPLTDPVWDYRGLKIMYKNNSNNNDGYYIYLPPRMPRYELLDVDKPDWYPEPTDNMAADPTVVGADPLLFWMDDGPDAPTDANADHYRYLLPDAITSAANWANGVTLPAGMLYLWDDQNSGTILEGVTFTAQPVATPEKWALFVPKGTALDQYLVSTYGALQYPDATLALATHLPAHYPSGGLKLITVGSDISRFLVSLMEQFLNHDHSTGHSLPSRSVNHKALNNNFSGTGTPRLDYCNDYDEGDCHPHYLERHGYQAGRDDYGSGMLGDLIMNSIWSSSNYLNTSSTSRKVWFNNPDTSNGAYIGTKYSSGIQLTLSSKDSGSVNNYINLQDPSLFDEHVTFLGDIPGSIMHIQNSADNTTLSLRTTGDVAPIIIRTSGSGASDISLFSDNHMTLTADVNLYLNGLDNTYLYARDNIDIYNQNAGGTTGNGDDISIRSNDQLYLHADDDVRITSVDDIFIDPDSSVNITAGNVIEVNKGIGVNPTETVWYSAPIRMLYSEHDVGGISASQWSQNGENSSFWLHEAGENKCSSYFYTNDYPDNSTLLTATIYYYSHSDDQVWFAMGRSDYNGGITQIQEVGPANTTGWKTTTLGTNMSLYKQYPFYVRVRHSNDSSLNNFGGSGGPDQDMIMAPHIRLQVQVRNISSYIRG